MDFARECLYDVRWQILRVNLLAENNDYGGWWSDFGAERNCDIVLNYAFEPGLQPKEQALRFWRCLNLLNAVLLSYSDLADKPATWRGVQQLRELLSQKHQDHPLPTALWNWGEQAQVAEAARLRELNMVHKDLQSRTLKYRPELIRFLTIIEAAIRTKESSKL